MSQTDESKNPQALFDKISQELAGTHQAMPGKMFGMACIKINGKAFAGFFQDTMAFKLTGDDHRAALKLEGSKLFDPSGQQRPMKEWVQVTFAHAKDWHHFAEQALEYVQDITERK